MCDAFWGLAAAHSISVWIEDAPGAINPADPPSRDCTACENPHSAPNKKRVAPNLFRRIFYPRHSLTQSQFNLPSGIGG